MASSRALAGHFGEDRDAVRIPLAEHGAGFDFLIFFGIKIARGNFVFFQLAALGV